MLFRLDVCFFYSHDEIHNLSDICLSTNYHSLFLLKVVDGMPVHIEENNKNGTDGKPGFQIPLVSVLKKQPVQAVLVELKPSKENGLPAVSGVDPKDATPVTEKHATAKSIANGC